MRMRLTVAAVVAFAFVSPAFASCNVRDMYTDKQAACAAACEDQFIRDKQHAEQELVDKAIANKKACDAKCGCEENSK